MTDAAVDRLWFEPASVVVIGASANPQKWGYQYARSLLKAGDTRRVYLVNPSASQILGQPVYGDCGSLPETPDLAVLCVPGAQIEASIDEALGHGIKRFVCITAGFAETGESGAERQRQMVDRVRRAGARLVGPNCLGLFDADGSLECAGFWDITAGEVGLVSQSGTVLLELSSRLAAVGKGLSRAISIGNQADVTAYEALESFSSSASSRVIAAYIEDFRDGRRVLSAMQALNEQGKRCILIAPADTDSVKRAASSHTGSLVASDALVDAACKDAGILRVRSISEAMSAIDGILAPAPTMGLRVAVIADGGGSALLGAAACADAGLEVPEFTRALRTSLAKHAHPGAGVLNPIDAVGVLCLDDMLPMIMTALESSEVDAVLLTGALNNVKAEIDPDEADRVAATIVDHAVRMGKGLAIASMYPDDPAMAAFRARGVTIHSGAVEAAEALALSVPMASLRPVPSLDASCGRATTEDGYFAARSLFSTFGAVFPKAVEVTDESAAVEAARQLGYPVVLKAMGLLHKSDAGGVAIGLADGEALRLALRDMQDRLSPPSFSIEQMVPADGVELILGSVRTPRFGPTITVGAGGIYTEVLRDVVTALAPVDETYAESMLQSLKIAPLLNGYRGKPPLARKAMARLIADFSRMLLRNPGIAEAEINPVRLNAVGAMALDARILSVDD
jgi:acyl-CoA synthetase (NDP forming)